MITRRNCLQAAAALGLAGAIPSSIAYAATCDNLITRAIPKTGERLPVVGLGTSATFRSVAQDDDVSALKAVMRTLIDNGGAVIDTAPSYGASEEVCGKIARESRDSYNIFWATKVNVASRATGRANEDATRAQIDTSLSRLDKRPLDLIQVHNLADLPTQMPIAEEYKQDRRIRYIGTTSTRASRYSDLERAMKDYPIDFIGVDYAVDNRLSAERILPLAQDLGIAVLVYVPFGRSRLWVRVKGRQVPEWASEFGADTWGKFFIKYAASHPAVTCVTPATSKATNMLDNIGAAYGELPDEAARRRMEEHVARLPSA